MSSHSSIKESVGEMGSSQFLPQLVASDIKNEKGLNQSTEVQDLEQNLKKQAEGAEKFHKLSWQKLTICLIVEAIALGSLSMPATFASLGMVLGTILTVFMGLLAIQTSDTVGRTFCKHRNIIDYAEAGRQMFGQVGYIIFAGMFLLFCTLVVGSHVLTGTIALATISGSSICVIVFGVVTAIALYFLALPPSFAEMAILGYIDFVSIICAILITMIATGVQAHDQVGGMGAVDWSLWPKENLEFSEGFLAITNIAFAYSFAVTQFSFMAEMNRPEDYKKAIWTLGIVEIVIYTVTGALIYAFVGQDVQSPALLSAGHTVAKVAFGVALPVIIISGSINSQVAGRFIHNIMYAGTPHAYINTKKGIISWLTIIGVITLLAFIIAESIPFFSDLLGLISSLFISCFSFSFPALMWFILLREGSCFERKNLVSTAVNGFIMFVGLLLIFAGMYSSGKSIQEKFDAGTVGSAFSCTSGAGGGH